MKSFVEFLTDVESIYGSFLSDNEYTFQHAVSADGGVWMAVFFNSESNIIKIHTDSRNADARIEFGRIDAPLVQQDSVDGKKVWHDTYDLMPEGWDTRTEEELLAAIPDKFPTTEEQLENQRDFLLEHYDEIMNTFNNHKNS